METKRNPKLRVLQLANTMARSDGGPAKNAFELHKALNARQDTATALLVLQRLRDRNLEQVTSGAPRLANGGSLVDDISVARAIRILRSADVLIIHGYYLWWAPIAAVVGRAFGKRIYLTPHGSLTTYQRQFSVKRKRLFDATVGMLLRASLSSFVLGSTREANEIRDKFRSSRTFVAGVGTDLESFQGYSDTPRDTTASSTIHLLSLSRIAPKKRIDLVIAAIEELRKRGRHISLTIAGTGDEQLESVLRQQVNTASLQEHVKFVGEVAGSEKQMTFARADIFLAPSDDENFGISVAEALSFGVACIASKHVASAEGLSLPGGIVLETRMPNAIADAIERLSDVSPAVRSTAARNFAEVQFSWTAVADRWHSVLISE